MCNWAATGDPVDLCGPDCPGGPGGVCGPDGQGGQIIQVFKVV